MNFSSLGLSEAEMGDASRVRSYALTFGAQDESARIDTHKNIAHTDIISLFFFTIFIFVSFLP